MNIKHYEEYLLDSGLHGYKIEGVDGSTTCVTEEKQSEGIIFNTTTPEEV